MNITIRKAEAADMEAVHRLVKQLAAFEHAAEQVSTSPEQYRTDAFEHQRFQVLVAESSESKPAIVGVALYFEAYSSWKGPFLWLDDLVVDEDCRGQGIGTALLHALKARAKSKNMPLIKWQVLDWNTTAIQLYDKLGSKAEQEWITYRWDID